MAYLPCLHNAFTLSQFCFLISRVSFEKSLLTYIPVPFRRLHLLKIFCLSLYLANFATIVCFIETFGSPNLCALSIFTFSYPRWFENVSISNSSVSSYHLFSYSSSPSTRSCLDEIGLPDLLASHEVRGCLPFPSLFDFSLFQIL